LRKLPTLGLLLPAAVLLLLLLLLVLGVSAATPLLCTVRAPGWGAKTLVKMGPQMAGPWLLL